MQIVHNCAQVGGTKFISIFFRQCRITFADEIHQLACRLAKLMRTKQHGIGRRRQILGTQDKRLQGCDIFRIQTFKRVGFFGIALGAKLTNQRGTAGFCTFTNCRNTFAVQRINRLGKQQNLVRQPFKLQRIFVCKPDKLGAFGNTVRMTTKTQQIP